MTLDTFIRQSIVRDDGLFSRMYGFNYKLAEYVHPSHLVDDDGVKEVMERVKGIRRVEGKLSEYLLKRLGFEGIGYFGFEDPRLRLALMEPEVLMKLLMYAGAGYYSSKISKVIKKEKLLYLKEGLGEEIYFFATKRAALVRALAPSIDVEGEGSREDVFMAGKRVLEICLADEHSKILRRLELKFPAGMKWDFGISVREEEKTRAWQYLQRLLFKEIEPGLKRCFI